MAFVGASALASGTTTCLPVYASATAGNLLVACVSGEKTATVNFTLSGSTTGWTQRVAIKATSITTEIWDKIATGSDTMPTWNMSGGAYMRCVVAEFSGTTTHDQSGTATGTVTPQTVTASGTDGGTGRLIIAAITIFRASTNATDTVSHNINGQGVGTGINVLGNDGGTSQGTHHNSVYSTTATTGSSADTDVMAWTTIISGLCALAIASYSSGTTTITGTAAVTLPAVTTAATGVRTTFASVLSIVAGTVMVHATSVRTTLASASSIVAGTVTVHATGVRTTFASGAVAVGTLNLAATGVDQVTGTAAVTPGAATLSATSLRTTFGAAALTVSSLTVASISLAPPLIQLIDSGGGVRRSLFGRSVRPAKLMLSPRSQVVTAKGKVSIGQFSVVSTGGLTVDGSADVRALSLDVVAVGVRIVCGESEIFARAVQIRSAGEVTSTLKERNRRAVLILTSRFPVLTAMAVQQGNREAARTLEPVNRR